MIFINYPLDVVQAYKSLQKEKEALESTVKALSSKPTQDGRRRQKQDTTKKYNESQDHDGAEEESQSKGHESPSIDHQSAKNEDDNDELDQLNEKISTLSKALATVTEEKSKMAAAFQADKKLAIVSYFLFVITPILVYLIIGAKAKEDKELFS